MDIKQINDKSDEEIAKENEVSAMPCYIRMKRSFLQGLLWLYLYGFGFMALSLEPGFLDFDNLPDTNFTCVGKVIGGYYADLETNCQMFHVCTIGQLEEPMDIRFLCLNGTVFDQETRVCERIDEVDCTKSEQFYSLNLELYGHSHSANLEEIETEQPLIIKSTPTTTTTTTTPRPRKTTRSSYYTSLPPSTRTPPSNSPHHHISTHHFPVLNPSASDIRFNPEEINISLHPGAPPDIRTKGPISYYSDKKVTNSENQLVVTTHRAVYHENAGSSTQKNQQVTVVYNSRTPDDLDGFGYTNKQEDSGEYTEPPESFRIRTEFRPSQQYLAPVQNPYTQRYKSSTYHTDYPPSTPKVHYQQQSAATTNRNYFVHSLKPPSPNEQNHYIVQTERSPQRIQLPLPVLPTLPPLTFSSPAPFSLQRRIEQKRYTKEHLPPPRVVISASASVSDASGRKLNYSLGTIGVAQIFKPPPRNYDEYKDEDVALDPFYLDVPKIKESRKKRSVNTEKRKVNYSDIIKTEEEALNVLKFLFDWYKSEKTNPARYTTPITTPLDNEGISSINDGLAPEVSSTEINEEDTDSLNFNFNSNDSFNKTSKYSTIGDDKVSVSHEVETKINNVQEKFTIKHEPDHEDEKDELFQHEEDYINDNYEPIAYKEQEHQDNLEESNDKYKSNKNYLHNEKYKNYSDYIDDNIEPIYYKERNYDNSVRKNNKNDIISDNYHNEDYDDVNNYHHKKYEEQYDTPIQSTTEANYRAVYNINNNNHYSSQALQSTTILVTTDQPEPEQETINVTTERSTWTTTKSKPTRRGVRKFSDINKDITIKSTKFLEKPFRAKDDYDFLRTVYNQTPTPTTYPTDVETEVIPTITESPSVTTSSIEPVTVVEVVTSIKENEDEDISDYMLTTAPVTSTQRSRRGKYKFKDNNSEETPLFRRNKHSRSKSKHHDNIATSSDYISKENSKSTSQKKPDNNIPEQNNYIDLYATSFVPTTESIHITKKKQLKENLLDTEFETTTQLIDTEPTEEMPDTTTWSPQELKKLIQDIESNTRSIVAPKPIKKLTTTTESVTTVQTITESGIKSRLGVNKSTVLNMTEMNLVSIALEEQDMNYTEDITTEEIPVTTEMLELNIHSFKFEKESMNNLRIKLEKAKHFEDDSNSVDETSTLHTTTTNLETTTNNINYTQIPTTYEHTTLIPILEETSTSTTETSTQISQSTKTETSIKTSHTTTTETSTENSQSTKTETSTEISQPYKTETSTVTSQPTKTETSTATTELYKTETSTETSQPTTTETTTKKPRRKGGKPTRHRPKTRNQGSGYRHRFSTDVVTKKSVSRKHNIEDEIVHLSRKGKDYTTESYRGNIGKKEYVLTDYPLKKSVNPTQAEKTVVTTPFSQNTPIQRQFFFNCFGKEIDRFYPDLRDCRLFHYCTQGYSKNQLLDMKFVCDFNTYFDDKKLICTKMKPNRCL